MKAKMLAMLTFFIFVCLITACMPQRNDYEQGLLAFNPSSPEMKKEPQLTDEANLTAQKAERRHFERGEQVGEELPFSTGQNPTARAEKQFLPKPTELNPL